MTDSTDNRTQDVLELAARLLTRLSEGIDLDEAVVDAEFLFRFEVTWCKWVSQIRSVMRAMLGRSGDTPLSDEDGARWLLHLESNVGLRVAMQLGNGEPHYVIENSRSRGAYHILDDDLEETSHALGERLLRTTEDADAHRAAFGQIWRLMWQEANQTSKIQNELDRLVCSYGLVPADHKLGEYAPNQIKRQYDCVVSWVVWGRYVPSFLDERTLLIESEVKEESRQTLRPQKWISGLFSAERMPLKVRIRTWAIYYCTRRGGGSFDQLSAVELWNARFPDHRVKSDCYEDDCGKVFAWGTGKGLAPSLVDPFASVRNRWAVLVGINEYDDPAYGQLHVCVKDVKAVHQRLISAGFDQDCVRLLTDFSGNLPTRLNILEALTVIASATGPDDLLLFYFSGHGIEVDDQSYLVSSDAKQVVIRDSAVPIVRVKEIVKDASARAKVIILDACHSGARIGSKGAAKLMSEAFRRHVFDEAEGIAILSSCKQGEVSYEWNAQERSVFTHFMLKALEGESDRDGKGWVTVQDVNYYVTDGVKGWAAQNGCVQTPTFEAATVGDIPLVRCQPQAVN